jgi:hypothetical protein
MKDTDLVIEQLEIHDAKGRARVLLYVTAEENRNSSLD